MMAQDNIDPSLERIETLLMEQCAHGAQTAGLPGDDAACGQFVAALTNPQRGLHGTAAALRVLAQSNSPEAAALVRRLVGYIQHRDQLHKEALAIGEAIEDQQNVIKISEVLYGLSFVLTSQSHKDTLVEELAGQLLAARKEDKGWPNFVGTSDPVDILPTAFAILALSRHGAGFEQSIAKQVAFLQSTIAADKGASAQNIDETSVRIFCVFALTFRKEELRPDEVKQLRREFIKLWKAHVTLFDQDLEQNIEYTRGATNHYVRVPWQLYLLALAARLDPKRISTFIAQRSLNRILNSVQATGFRYPYSGASLSSRTNAILFDVLHKIKRFHRWNIFHAVHYGFDRVRTFLSHPVFAYTTLIVPLILAAYCVYAWLQKGWRADELGPEFIGSFILLLITFFVERLRKAR